MQKYDSAKTSVNTVPRLFSRVSFRRGTVNFDIGGGRFDTVTKLLRKRGVSNYVYDPYNRTDAWNSQVLTRVACGADTATISNVLNVIKEPARRQEVLELAAEHVKNDGEVYITVYEGDRSGKGKRTSCGYQLNRPIAKYLGEVRQVFGEVSLKNGVITARGSR